MGRVFFLAVRLGNHNFRSRWIGERLRKKMGEGRKKRREVAKIFGGEKYWLSAVSPFCRPSARRPSAPEAEDTMEGGLHVCSTIDLG